MHQGNRSGYHASYADRRQLSQKRRNNEVPTVVDSGSAWLDRIWVVHVDHDSDMLVDFLNQVEEQNRDE